LIDPEMRRSEGEGVLSWWRVEEEEDEVEKITTNIKQGKI